jgi:hypothetical protein
MLVSHGKQFIYCKTVKTAGTSVEVYFEPYCTNESTWEAVHHRQQHESAAGVVGYRGPDPKDSRWVNHMSASAIRAAVGATIWDAYRKFAVVRNPFDVLVSYYWFLRAKGAALPGSLADSPVDGFRAWLDEGVPVFGREQMTIDGEFCLDHYLRYEHLLEDLEKICHTLAVPFEQHRLPRFKAGLRGEEIPLAAYYSPRERQMVEDVYAPELAFFGYSAPV